jgi:hypothetical protein
MRDWPLRFGAGTGGRLDSVIVVLVSVRNTGLVEFYHAAGRARGTIVGGLRVCIHVDV